MDVLEKRKKTLTERFTNPSLSFLLILFLALAFIVTSLATVTPYILKYYGFIDVPPPAENHWGSLGDWYSGVLGISVGFAGTAIAIWLAYRVEALSSHQAKLAQIQTVIDMAKEEGSISRRCDWARIAGNHIDHLFSTIQRLISNDLEYGREQDALDKEEPNETCDWSTEHGDLPICPIRKQYIQKAEIEYEEIWRSLRGLEAVLSAAAIQFSPAEIARALNEGLGNLPHRLMPHLKKFIEFQNAKDPENIDSYLKQLASITYDAILRSTVSEAARPDLEVESHLSCIRFLIEANHARGHMNSLEIVYHRNYQADRSASVWDTLALWGKSRLGDIFDMDPYSKYLPRTEFFIDHDESVVIYFIPAFVSAVMEVLNPVKIADEALEQGDMKVLLDSGDFIPERLQDIVRAPLTNLAKRDPSFYRCLTRLRPAAYAQVHICVKDHTPDEAKYTQHPKVRLRGGPPVRLETRGVGSPPRN
ncbi:hypothetical protein [Roseovarius sp. CH_XMU1461]|uniref:hypothetical protein n=1 Tax=Roseovarius sp. CH_XMU1461 TaxID=3107777 RepID=UPI00300A9C09